MFLRPFGLYSQFVSILQPINPEKTNRNNNGGSVGKSYSNVHEGYGRVTPGKCSWNFNRRERVQAKVQRLKTGPPQLRDHTPTEKHAGLGASRWQSHH